MKLRRALATMTSTFVLSTGYLAPAIANKRDDGDEPGAVLNAANAIVLFGLIPLAIIALITLFVLAPGWTKKSKDLTKY
jgi:hypothetical protein